MFLADLCLSIAAMVAASDDDGDGSGGGDASVIDCYCCVQWQLDSFSLSLFSSLKLIHFTNPHSSLYPRCEIHTTAACLFLRSFILFVRLLCVLAHLLVASVSFSRCTLAFNTVKLITIKCLRMNRNTYIV